MNTMIPAIATNASNPAESVVSLELSNDLVKGKQSDVLLAGMWKIRENSITLHSFLSYA